MGSHDQQILEREQAIEIVVRETFFSALHQGAWRRFRNSLLRKPNCLVAFEDVYGDAQLIHQYDTGTHPVAIRQIVGSMGRVDDFDRNFLPRNRRSINRWMSIARALHSGTGLPAVQLYKVGEQYFVKDGNHRISVASAYGQDFIDAAVTEIVLA